MTNLDQQIKNLTDLGVSQWTLDKYVGFLRGKIKADDEERLLPAALNVLELKLCVNQTLSSVVQDADKLARKYFVGEFIMWSELSDLLKSTNPADVQNYPSQLNLYQRTLLDRETAQRTMLCSTGQ